MSLEPAPLPTKPSHPGYFIENVLLKRHHMSVEALSERTDINRYDLQDIIKGKADISPNVAKRLRKEFGLAADRLLDLQMVYDFFEGNGRKPTREESDILNSSQYKPIP